MEPDRVDTTAEAVLDALLLRLRTFFSMGEGNCFVCAEPRDIKLPPGGDFFLSVSIWDGTFDTALQIGGGVLQCSERLTFGISIYTRAKLDRANQDPHAIRRLIQQKRRLLSCLCAHDLQLPSGEVFLRQLIPIESASHPQLVDDGKAYFLTVYLSCEFDWDLTQSSSSDDSVSSSSSDSTSSDSSNSSSSSSESAASSQSSSSSTTSSSESSASSPSSESSSASSQSSASSESSSDSSGSSLSESSSASSTSSSSTSSSLSTSSSST